MTVVCNTRCLNAHLTGVQRYTQNILSFFPEKIECQQPSPNTSRGIRGHLWEQFSLPARVKKRLLRSPSNSGPISYTNQVVTIHDVVSLDHPEWFNKTYVKWYNYMLPHLCKNARHIITISDFSKSRIMEKLKVPDSKITRIYNGCDDLIKTETSSKPFDVP